MSCPSIQTTSVKVKNGTILIVRDDLLPGGTKQRAGVPFLQYFKNQGIKEFVYASPFSGFAQIALSICANLVGVKCKIFSQVDVKTKQISNFSKTASSHAEIILCSSLEDAEKRAFDYCFNNQDSFLVPLGMNHPVFIDFLKNDLSKQLELIKFKSIWVPVGSGTLSKVFRDITPNEINIKCVDVKVLTEEDIRIKNVKNMHNVRYMKVFENFHDPCLNIPPVPSNIFYDAKLWKYVFNLAEDGDIWWNVAS